MSGERHEHSTSNSRVALNSAGTVATTVHRTTYDLYRDERPIENMENLRTSCTVMYVQTVEIRLLSTNSYLFLGVNLLYNLDKDLSPSNS